MDSSSTPTSSWCSSVMSMRYVRYAYVCCGLDGPFLPCSQAPKSVAHCCSTRDFLDTKPELISLVANKDERPYESPSLDSRATGGCIRSRDAL
jgi:hypothetical protein